MTKRTKHYHANGSSMGIRPHISASLIKYASLDTGTDATGRPKNKRASTGRTKMAMGDTDNLGRFSGLDAVLTVSP